MAVRYVLTAPSAAPRRPADPWPVLPGTGRRPRPRALVAGVLCALLLVALSLAWSLWLAPGRGRTLRGQEAVTAREFERAAAHRADVVRRATPHPGIPGT